MARLREGRANTARAAHFLRETVSRVRYGGASGQLTMRVDSGFYTHAVVSACRETNVRFSITIRQHKSLRNLIEAIPEELDADTLLDGARRTSQRQHPQNATLKGRSLGSGFRQTDRPSPDLALGKVQRYAADPPSGQHVPANSHQSKYAEHESTGSCLTDGFFHSNGTHRCKFLRTSLCRSLAT